MTWIPRSKNWEMPERQATSEQAYMDRRKFVQKLGLAGAGLLSTLSCGNAKGGDEVDWSAQTTATPTSDLYPAARNAAFALDRPLTDEGVAATHNNFYEFTTNKDQVHRLVEKFQVRPWQVEVTGLVHKPQVFDIDELVRQIPLEERLYRFRCVEAWAMAVPWTGFPFKALMDRVQPQTSARFVRLVTFYNPEQARGQRLEKWWPWPYYEGLTMEEASNELTLLTTGIYGHELPKQHGAPIRLVVPWKYGYKSIKSIVRIEFVEKRPPTFWNDQAPSEYGFWSNVNPAVPHPRWSQASEKLIGTGERVPTQLYNGYGEYVAHLYKKT